MQSLERMLRFPFVVLLWMRMMGLQLGMYENCVVLLMVKSQNLHHYHSLSLLHLFDVQLIHQLQNYLWIYFRLVAMW